MDALKAHFTDDTSATMLVGQTKSNRCGKFSAGYSSKLQPF